MSTKNKNKQVTFTKKFCKSKGLSEECAKDNVLFIHEYFAVRSKESGGEEKPFRTPVGRELIELGLKPSLVFEEANNYLKGVHPDNFKVS